MRIQEILIAALFLGVAAASATETRANGAYTSLTLSSPAACARACADDGICMAWTYRENACELSAIVAAPPVGVVASGFADRAPALALRQLTESATPITAPVAEAPAPIPDAAYEAAPPSETADASLLLLGGPEEDDLRLRLSGRR